MNFILGNLLPVLTYGAICVALGVLLAEVTRPYRKNGGR